jgi:nucleoside recognition membrane protein YjiH
MKKIAGIVFSAMVFFSALHFMAEEIDDRKSAELLNDHSPKIIRVGAQDDTWFIEIMNVLSIIIVSIIFFFIVFDKYLLKIGTYWPAYVILCLSGLFSIICIWNIGRYIIYSNVSYFGLFSYVVDFIMLCSALAFIYLLVDHLHRYFEKKGKN